MFKIALTKLFPRGGGGLALGVSANSRANIQLALKLVFSLAALDERPSLNKHAKLGDRVIAKFRDRPIARPAKIWERTAARDNDGNFPICRETRGRVALKSRVRGIINGLRKHRDRRSS